MTGGGTTPPAWGRHGASRLKPQCDVATRHVWSTFGYTIRKSLPSFLPSFPFSQIVCRDYRGEINKTIGKGKLLNLRGLIRTCEFMRKSSLLPPFKSPPPLLCHGINHAIPEGFNVLLTSARASLPHRPRFYTERYCSFFLIVTLSFVDFSFCFFDFHFFLNFVEVTHVL